MDLEMDLDIQNYSLEEIMNLFKIPLNFDVGDLKRAKKLVLMSHPDKSNLPSEYFLFYSKAYKILFSIFEFKNKSRTDQTTDYAIIDNDMKEMTKEEKGYLSKYLKENSDFSKWFNEEFEKRKEKEEGYESWLKSDEDIENETIKMNEMNQYFEKKRMVVKEEIKEYSVGNYTSLGESNDYGSDMFSNLYYSDLKKAHSPNFVPLENRRQVTVDEYKKNRKIEDVKNVPLDEKQSLLLLNKKVKMEEEDTVARAYYFAKKTQESERLNQLFMSKMKMLK
jgi:hypothetical protein